MANPVDKELSDVAKVVERLEYGVKRLRQEHQDVLAVKNQLLDRGRERMERQRSRRDAQLEQAMQVRDRVKAGMERQNFLQAQEMATNVRTLPAVMSKENIKNAVKEEGKSQVRELVKASELATGETGKAMKAIGKAMDTKAAVDRVKTAAKESETVEEVGEKIAAEITNPVSTVPVVGDGIAAVVNPGTQLGIKLSKELAKVPVVKKGSKKLHDFGAKHGIGKFSKKNILPPHLRP